MVSAAVLLLSLAAPADAQGFGQNQVIKRDFRWQVRSTRHFDIHYYEDSAALVPTAAEFLERAYARISSGLGTGFEERRPLFLYANPNDFQQSTIAEAGDGTGGITEPFKDRFMVYNDGTRQWLDDVLTHELVHVFQFKVLVSGFWKSARILKTVVYPLWMMEGMAEHFTEGLDDTTEELYLRDAATSGRLIPLWKLEHFSHLKPHQVTLAYKSGATVMAFIASQYGKDKIGRMLSLFESRFESSSVLSELLGLDIRAFDAKWREYLEEKYRRIARAERLREPSDYGVALTTSSPHLPEFNTTPVPAQGGRALAYLSTKDGFPPEVRLQELPSGRTRRIVADAHARIENIPMGNFTNISRVLAVSPDGHTLAFGAQKNHAHSIYLFDLRRRRLRRLPLPGLMTASQPAFSPDGSRLAFSGMKNGFTDIYLLDLKTGAFDPLTSDPQDDQSPNFSPDGRSLVYSSEVEIPGGEMRYQRRLYRLSLADRAALRIEDIPGAARDPVHSADGSRLLFTVEGGGFTDVYELELASGRAWRLTRTLGGAFTPAYAANGDVFFCAFRSGSVHIYQAPRSRLLAEALPLQRRRTSTSFRLPAAAETAVSTASVLSPERPMAFSASTDLFLPAFFYSSQGGLFWTSYWQGSDMLGVHQAGAAVAYNSGTSFLNYQAQYGYNRWRPKFALALFGMRQSDLVDRASGLDANRTLHAQYAQAQYPLDRYHRLELLAGLATERFDYPALAGSRSRNDARLIGSSFVRDTVGGRYLVAVKGSRLRLSYAKAAQVLGGNVDYYTFSGEGHRYFPTGSMSALTLRGVAAGAWGQDRLDFVLGGIGGVRGYARSTDENVGNRIALATAEYRFPLLRNLDYYMWYIFPDFYFKAVTAAVFTDAGYTWNERSQLVRARWSGVRHSYGVGLRIHTFILQLFPLVLHMDYAQRTTSDGGVFYVYLGPLF